MFKAKTNRSKKFYFVAFILIVIAVILYFIFPYKSNSNEVAYFMKTTPAAQSIEKSPTNNTVDKKFGTLIVTTGKPVSHDMANGILCIQNSSELEKVDLYMPAMGHGSEPPVVKSSTVPPGLTKYTAAVPNFGCFSVDSMQLFMPGLWQVRVFYKSGAIGTFDINLEK